MAVPFHFGNLVEASHVALAAVEPRTEEYPDEIGGKLGADDLRAEAEHVHVVVLDALVGGVDVVADGGTDSRELAGRDRGADPGAADEHAALCLTAEDGLADLPRLLGIVDPLGSGVGAQVHDLVPGEHLEHRVSEMDAAMVECDCHLHTW